MTIKERRTELGLSQQKFGNLLHIPMRTIQDWERGVRKCPAYVEELILYRLKGEEPDISELLKETAEENQTKKILEMLNESEDLEEAKEKVKALLVR